MPLFQTGRHVGGLILVSLTVYRGYVANRILSFLLNLCHTRKQFILTCKPSNKFDIRIPRNCRIIQQCYLMYT